MLVMVLHMGHIPGTYKGVLINKEEEPASPGEEGDSMVHVSLLSVEMVRVEFLFEIGD